MYAELVSFPFMGQNGLKAFHAEALVQAMLSFELALAESEESLGLLPSGTHKALDDHLATHAFDMAGLAGGVGEGGNVAIPFVAQAKAALPEALKKSFHKGATSQDVLDSALMLLMQDRLAELCAQMDAVREALMRLIERYRDTPMIGRSLLQQALPTTFGLRAAQWALNFDQAARRLATLRRERLPVQFGGAVGTHAGLQDAEGNNLGLSVMAQLAERLGLQAPLLPWHTNRQPIHALASAFDALAGAGEKIATDIALLAQNEVAEVNEPAAPGMGVSSSMPHKRNPVRCALIRTAARQTHGHLSVIANAQAQPLERALGEWHAEWAPLVEMALLSEGMLTQLTTLLQGLEVFPDAMREQLSQAKAGGDLDIGSSPMQADRVMDYLKGSDYQ
ncbi:3-carboxy-cis,cis-muconate cycloisomerase [Halomonas shantousis]